MHETPRRLGRSIAWAAVTALAVFAFAPPAHGAHAAGAPVPPAAEPAPAAPPSDDYDLAGWLAYRGARNLDALPFQAQLFYRGGVEKAARGESEAAVRLWRGAEELDPTFLAPRAALASHLLTRDTPQGLIEIARLVSLARSNFRLQHYLTAAAIYFGLIALYLATLGVALVLCWRHRDRVRHVYQELLGRYLPAGRASLWSWALFLLPWALGVGAAVPAAFTLSLLWSYLRRTERLVLVLLAAVLCASPFATRLLDDLSLPLRPGEAPLYSTLEVQNEPYTAARFEELSRLAQSHPENPFLAYAAGWMAEKGRRYDEAVAAYGQAQSRWPREVRIPNNLGNIEATRGNAAAAEAHYRRAIELAPRWAVAHYNLGQLYTQHFRYAEASEEIAQATALDFDLVRNLQSRSSGGAAPALAAEWLEPRSQWQALFAGEHQAHGRTVVPPLWRGSFESRGLASAVWAVVLTVLGLGLGFFLHHLLPARACGNCAATLCRRCATRRRDQVLCGDCASVLSTATTPEFGKLLLFKRRRELRRRQRTVRTVLAAILPGFGALVLDRTVLGWFLMLSTWLSALLLFLRSAPFPYDPRVVAHGPDPLTGAATLGLVASYAISLLNYLALASRESHAERDAAAAIRPAARLKRAA